MDTESTLPDDHAEETTPSPKPMSVAKNPFSAGYRPPSMTKKKGKAGGYLQKRSLLKMMLEIPLTVNDLPTWLADNIRAKCPGFLDNVERKFTMYQIMEMTQFQLLFSGSDYVRQDAINAIKDRVEGKPMQKIQVENMEVEPTQFVLPGGRVIVI